MFYQEDKMDVYTLRKFRKVVVKEKKLKYIKYKEKKTQISRNHDEGPRNGREHAAGDDEISDDEDETHSDIALKCLICLDRYVIEKRKLLIARCGHSLCHLCCGRLMKQKTYMKCPLCRAIVQKSDLVQPHFFSARTLAINDRDKVLRYLRKGEKNILNRITDNVKNIIRIDSERLKQLTIPLYCSSVTLSKKRPELLAALCHSEMKQHFHDLNVLTGRLNKFIVNVKKLING